MRPDKLDLLAYKIKSSDSDAFVEAAVAYSPRSLVFVYDFDKIRVAYDGVGFAPPNREFSFIKTASGRLNHYLSPLLLFLQMLTYVRVLGTACGRYRPRVCWVENAFAGLLIGLLRRCRVIGKTFYLPGDWLVNKHNKRFLSFLANNVLFPQVDYLCCRLNDVVLDHTKLITEARDRYWGRRITHKQGWYSYKPRLRFDLSRMKSVQNSICFIGQMRPECGLDIAILSLPLVRKIGDIDLVVIGPKTMSYEYFKALAETNGVADHVRFLGYLENDQLADVMRGSFCGLNLLTIRDSYSSYTMPGKIMHYLQHLLPIIVSAGVGAFADTLKQHGLGEVIEPSVEKFEAAVTRLYRDQAGSRERIVSYIASLPDMDLKDYIDTDVHLA